MAVPTTGHVSSMSLLWGISLAAGLVKHSAAHQPHFWIKASLNPRYNNLPLTYRGEPI